MSMSRRRPVRSLGASGARVADRGIGLDEIAIRSECGVGALRAADDCAAEAEVRADDARHTFYPAGRTISVQLSVV